MTRPYSDAIGPNDGDSIVFENQWARVTVRRDGPGGLPGVCIFELTGDTLLEQPRYYARLADAIDAAITALAAYQKGRAS